MNFKKRLLIIIGIPLGVCLILATALFFISSDIAKRTEQIKQLRSEIVFGLQSTESLAILSKEAEQAKNYIVQLENILPQRDQLVTFPRDLNIIAKQAQVDANSTLGQEESSGGDAGLRQTSFSVTGQGSFDNLLSFLKFLEGGQYLVSLKMLDFTQQDGGFKTLLTGQVFSF
jgi:Tfp pilus assembly protein PilN